MRSWGPLHSHQYHYGPSLKGRSEENSNTDLHIILHAGLGTLSARSSSGAVCRASLKGTTLLFCHHLTNHQTLSCLIEHASNSCGSQPSAARLGLCPRSHKAVLKRQSSLSTLFTCLDWGRILVPSSSRWWQNWVPSHCSWRSPSH